MYITQTVAGSSWSAIILGLLGVVLFLLTGETGDANIT